MHNLHDLEMIFKLDYSDRIIAIWIGYTLVGYGDF